ncbi:MAG TPA: fibronectin type III domain-containing protein [Prolixibacteraceae bacterium]|nr:fibronectin type III domain-containing protein [Prolixibacteraceae bacterium]
MKKIKAVLTFLRLSIIEKIGFYRNVIEKMTDNPNFPSPDVPMTEVTVSVDKLEKAYYAARDGSHVAIAEMHQCEEESDEIFRKLVDYVNRIADGDESMIRSSGFETSKEPKPRKKSEFIVIPGNKPGSFILRRQAVKGARSYLWQYCKGDSPAPEGEWTVLDASTQATYEVTGLTSGTKYWFRVAAVTSEGTGAFTSPVSKIAQ